jgi:hypothetical protein
MMGSDALGCNHTWAGRAYGVEKRRVTPRSLNVGYNMGVERCPDAYGLHNAMGEG